MYSETKQEKIASIIQLFCREGPLPDELVQLILMFAGLLFVGRRSLMWVQYV